MTDGVKMPGFRLFNVCYGGFYETFCHYWCWYYQHNNCVGFQKKGYEVTVFDRNRYPAMETSFANGGQLSASNAEVWTNISTMLKGVKWMFKSDAPLLFNPKPSWHKYSWMSEFASNFRNYEKNTVKTTKLAIQSRQHMTAFAEEAGIEFNREDRGILHFYKKEADFNHAHRVNKMLAEGGLDRRRLTPDEVYAIEPAIKSKVIGGYYTESDFTGDIHKFTMGLAEAAAEAGVNFTMNATVTDVDHDSGSRLSHGMILMIPSSKIALTALW